MTNARTPELHDWCHHHGEGEGEGEGEGGEWAIKYLLDTEHDTVDVKMKDALLYLAVKVRAELFCGGSLSIR